MSQQGLLHLPTEIISGNRKETFVLCSRARVLSALVFDHLRGSLTVCLTVPSLGKLLTTALR